MVLLLSSRARLCLVEPVMVPSSPSSEDVAVVTEVEGGVGSRIVQSRGTVARVGLSLQTSQPPPWCFRRTGGEGCCSGKSGDAGSRRRGLDLRVKGCQLVDLSPESRLSALRACRETRSGLVDRQFPAIKDLGVHGTRRFSRVFARDVEHERDAT